MKEKTYMKKTPNRWHFERSFSCIKNYEQFLNWFRFEFYFLQQDQEPYLTFYFPNGHVEITKEIEKDDVLVSKISLESKCLKIGLKMNKRISDFFEYLERYNKLSQASCGETDQVRE